MWGNISFHLLPYPPFTSTNLYSPTSNKFKETNTPTIYISSFSPLWQFTERRHAYIKCHRYSSSAVNVVFPSQNISYMNLLLLEPYSVNLKLFRDLVEQGQKSRKKKVDDSSNAVQNDDQGGKCELRWSERQGIPSLQFEAYQRIYHGKLATPSFAAMVKREGSVCAKEH